MAVWKGAALVETETGGLLSSRWWAVTTANSDPTGDQTGWEYTAGTVVTVYYRTGTDGGAPPNAADNVQIEVRDSAGTVLEVLSTGAPPTNGDSFTHTLTKAGPVELYIRVDYDGTVGDYNVSSQNVATVGTVSAWTRGLVRSNAQITDLAVSAYPAGSTFAYGTAADEVITLTATHTTPYTTTDGDIRLDALDVTAVQIQGVAKNYTSTTTTQTFTANNGFDDSSKSYGVKAVPIGNPFIVPDSGAVGWTKFIDSGNGEQVGESVRRQSFYTVDPRITMGTPTLGETVYNRDELATVDFTLTNARAESLTRSIAWQIKNSGAGVVTSGNDTGANYDADYTIVAGDDSTADITGAQWTINTNQADVTSNPSANIYSVSDLYHVDLHQQRGGTLNKDDWPNPDSFEHFEFVILGNVIYTWVHVEGVRKDNTEIDTSGSAIQILVKNPDGGVDRTFNVDTGADGWSPRLDIQPDPPAGEWTHECTVTFGGNTGTDTETITTITPLTSNLQIMALPPVLAKPGSAFRFYVRSEVDSVGAEPQSQPTYKIYDSQLSDTLVASGGLLNAADDTATINGHIYYVDITLPTTPGRYVFWAEAKLNGNLMKTDSSFRIAIDDFDPTGLFAGPP